MTWRTHKTASTRAIDINDGTGDIAYGRPRLRPQRDAAPLRARRCGQWAKTSVAHLRGHTVCSDDTVIAVARCR